MRIFLIVAFFAVFCLCGRNVLAQDKPLFKAVQQARAKVGNKATNTVSDLFAPNGIDKATQSPDHLIYKLTLNPATLARIRQEKRDLLEIAIPTANGPVELALVPATIFAPGFTVKTSVPDSNFTFDASKFQFYQGVLKNDPNSIVTLMLTDGAVTAAIADSTGNRVLAHNRDKAASANDYALYNEKAIDATPRPFSCGTVDSGPASTSVLGDTAPIDKANSSCVKYAGVYFEADYALYQYYGGDVNALINGIAFVFQQTRTLYQNESVYIQWSGLKVWNVADPYSGATDSREALTIFRSRWNGLNDEFPGQTAHLLSNRNLGGGFAFLNVLSPRHRQYAYAVSGGLNLYLTRSYPTYSWEVFVVTHELGHNFGSQHTQWCGWPGGAIDNCAPTEGGCPRGPAVPTNGGTIMS